MAVAGAEGRMGRLIVELIQNDPETEVIAKVTRSQPLALSKTNSIEKDPPIDVLIDFSHRDAVLEHLSLCSARNIPMVIGVTGLEETQKERIRKTAQTLPILMSPNMSIGANVVFNLLSLATSILQKQHSSSEKNIDIAITEIHHRHKKDAPSGTAKYMGEIIQKHMGNTKSGAHETTPIQYSSLRLGEVMGDHRALFALEGEQLEITHKAEDRVIFAKGALLAAKWLHQRINHPGLYSMQDVLVL